MDKVNLNFLKAYTNICDRTRMNENENKNV